MMNAKMIEKGGLLKFHDFAPFQYNIRICKSSIFFCSLLRCAIYIRVKREHAGALIWAPNLFEIVGI